MRDRIKASNLTVLFICPSMKMGTLERRALNDCIFLRDIGGNPVLYCQRKSPIAQAAQKQDIMTIHYSGRTLKRKFEYTFYKDLRNLLREGRYDLIHCYGLHFVWMVCLTLLGNSKVPLIITENATLGKGNKTMFKKWLARRIDLILVANSSNSQNLKESLPINTRKINITGAGLEVGKKKFAAQENKKVLGTFLNADYDIKKKMELILFAIPYLLKKTEDLTFDLEFIFYSDRPWVTVKEFPVIQELIETLELGNIVKLENIKQSADQIIQTLNIYISTDFEEPYNDFEIMALLYFVPTAFPRTASRQELLSNRRHVGETYYLYDSRELKDKLLKLILDEPLYVTHIQEFHEKLSELHGMESYFERLMMHYEHNYEKRQRITERIKKSLIS